LCKSKSVFFETQKESKETKVPKVSAFSAHAKTVKRANSAILSNSGLGKIGQRHARNSVILQF
jgi:hypothetical protein